MLCEKRKESGVISFRDVLAQRQMKKQDYMALRTNNLEQTEENNILRKL